MNPSHFDVEEKSIEAMRVAGLRLQGRYRDCGPGFARLGRAAGRHITGKGNPKKYLTEIQMLVRSDSS